MFKKTKMALMSLLCVGCCMAAGAGALSYTEASAQTVFKVDDGAAVRLKMEEEEFGIRFSATVGEVVEGAKYNMLILPVELVEYYNADTTANKADIVTYMKALAESKGGSLSIVEDCAVRSDGKIYASIVDVLWKNINRDFVAVAYYEKDGEIVVAEMAEDGARSVVDVSNNALESGDYNGADKTDDKAILIDKVRKGEKQAEGYSKEDTYIYEDFRYADEYSTYSAVGISSNSNATTEVVDFNKDKAIQVTRKTDYNYTAVEFGTVSEGVYQFTFQLKESEGYDYNNWKLLQWNEATEKYDLEKCSVWDLEALGNNTYSYYFTATEEMKANFAFAGLVGSGWTGTGQMTLDNLTLKEVKTAVKRDITTLLNEDFEGTTVSPYQMGSVQNVSDFDVIKLVDNGDNGNALRLEKKAGEKCTVDFVLPLGKVTKGQYKLTLQMKTNYNQALSLQNVTLQNDYQLNSLNNAVQAQADFNYGNFYGIGSGNTDYFQAQARPLGDDVWEYHINFKKDMDCAGLRLYNYFTTLPEGGIYLQLDNVKFERSCEVVVDFENGRVVDYSQSGAVGTGKDYANTPYIRTTNATEASTNTRSLYDFATKKFTGTTPDSGDRTYTNIAHGNYGYCLRLMYQTKLGISLGYVEAGTYEVTWEFGLWGNYTDFKFYNGEWAYWGTSETHNGAVTYRPSGLSVNGTVAGNKITYTIEVTKDTSNYYCTMFPCQPDGTTVIVLDSFSFKKVA